MRYIREYVNYSNLDRNSNISRSNCCVTRSNPGIFSTAEFSILTSEASVVTAVLRLMILFPAEATDVLKYPTFSVSLVKALTCAMTVPIKARKSVAPMPIAQMGRLTLISPLFLSRLRLILRPKSWRLADYGLLLLIVLDHLEYSIMTDTEIFLRPTYH